MRVHVAQEEEERLLLLGQAVQLGDGDVVEVLRLGAAALVPAAPAGEVEIVVEAARGRVAAEADAGGGVALLAQDLGQRLHLRAQRPLVAQRHHLGAEHIHAGEHGAVAAGGGDVRAVGALEQRAALGEAVHVRRGQPGVAIAAHVVGTQRVDAEKEDIGFSFGWHRISGILDC